MYVQYGLMSLAATSTSLVVLFVLVGWIHNYNAPPQGCWPHIHKFWPLPVGAAIGIVVSLGVIRLLLRIVFPAQNETIGELNWLSRKIHRILYPQISNAIEHRLHEIALGFTTALAVMFAIGPLGATPATALCVALGLVTGVYGFLSFHVPTNRDGEGWSVLSNRTLLLLLLLVAAPVDRRRPAATRSAFGF